MSYHTLKNVLANEESCVKIHHNENSHVWCTSIIFLSVNVMSIISTAVPPVRLEAGQYWFCILHRLLHFHETQEPCMFAVYHMKYTYGLYQGRSVKWLLLKPAFLKPELLCCHSGEITTHVVLQTIVIFQNEFRNNGLRGCCYTYTNFMINIWPVSM